MQSLFRREPKALRVDPYRLPAHLHLRPHRLRKYLGIPSFPIRHLLYAFHDCVSLSDVRNANREIEVLLQSVPLTATEALASQHQTALAR